MEIYLSAEKKTIRIPVLPDGFEIQTKQNNQTVNITKIGDINLSGNRGLKGIAFSSFFPLYEGKHGYERHGSHKEPYVLVNTIEKWKDKSQPVRLIITQSNVNAEFLIDEFSYGPKDGSGDIEYTINLSEYIRPKVSVKNGKKSALYSSSRSTKAVPVTYTVRKGDTLKSIAKKQLGSSKKFTEIASKNHIAAPYKVEAGTVLLLKN